MKSSLVTLAILVAVVSADVSHLAGHYLPPNYQLLNQRHQHHNHHPDGIQVPMHPNQRSTNKRVETTIEKHEVVELPTQIEIIKEGQPIYGIHPQSIEMVKVSSNNNNNEYVPEIQSRYLPPAQEIENLQPLQIPYEMPMRTYLPPVAPDTTTTDVPPTTTTSLPPTTTNIPSMEEETTTEQQFTTEQDINNYATSTTEIPTEEEQSYDTTTSPLESVAMPAANRYLPPMSMMPQNQYLPPVGMMLPPPAPIPQLSYQQYQEQLMREQHMQQMYHEQEMQEMMHAIAEMEQQQLIALELQEQPIAPVEPGHVLRDDGYHYKTTEDDFRRNRYRHQERLEE